MPIILPQYLLSIPIIENSLRKFSKDFVFNQFSYPPYMLITYLFPHIFGGIGNIDYWGPDKEYPGIFREYINYLFIFTIPTTLLGIYSVIKYKKTDFYFFLVLAIVSLILSFGKYTIFSYILYSTPLYSDFRVSARNMFQFNLAISMLSLLGILYLIKIIKQKSKNYNFLFLVKKLIIIYTIFIFICLSFILLVESNNFVNLLLSLFFTLVLEYKLTIFFLLFLFVYVYLFYRFKYLQIGKITTLLVLILVLEKSFLYFSNNYFNLNIKKTEEIEKLINFPNLATKNFWQYHYFIPNLPESNLIATNEKIRVLNIYDPFLNIDYYYLFRILWGNQIEDIHLYGLLRNNLLISTFGVNYITTLENIQKLEKINKVSYEDLQVKKIQDFDIYQKDKIISINFKEKLNTDFIILIASINKQQTKQNFIEKISKLVLEKREILTVNIGDVYTLNLSLDHIGHPIEKDNITLILPLPVNSKIKEITLNYFNTYNKIKIENIEIYAYPINTIPSLIPSKKQAAYIKINNNLTSLDNSLFSYINTNSLPFLFSVKKIKIISNIVEFKKLIFLFKINTKDTVTIEKDQILQIKKYLLENMNELIKNKTEKLDPENLNLEELDFYDPIIKNLKIGRNSVFVELYCPKISFIVINNSYHKNWKFYLNNNKEVPIFKANCIAQ